MFQPIQGKKNTGFGHKNAGSNPGKRESLSKEQKKETAREIQRNY
jgi:hypothetical protein